MILLFSVTIIPKVMLKSYAATLPVRVKVLERFSDAFGEVVVYAPSAAARKYVKNYRIAKNERGVYFRGEWEKKAAYAEYELTVYGSDNKVLEVLHVKEKFNGGKTTHATYLHKDADYVTLRVLCVDDTPLPDERRKFNFGYACWLAVLCISLVFATDLLLWLITTFVLRCMDGFSMRLNLPVGQWAALLGYPALFITVTTCLISLGKFFLSRWGAKENE